MTTPTSMMATSVETPDIDPCPTPTRPNAFNLIDDQLTQARLTVTRLRKILVVTARGHEREDPEKDPDIDPPRTLLSDLQELQMQSADIGDLVEVLATELGVTL